MAKQNKPVKEFTFSKIGSIMKEISKDIPIEIVSNDEATNREMLDTGIYLLNAAMSTDIYGGLQSNRITVFAAPSGCGKSFLCYSVVKNAQKKGWNCIYIDTEFSIELDKLPGYGVDISEDKFMLIRSNIVEDVLKLLTQLLDSMKEAKRAGEKLPKTMIIMDSVGMLASKREHDNALNNKDAADFTRAKSLASMFRLINGDLGYLNIPMICTNHTYSTMDLYSKDVMKGGNGLFYSASVIGFMTKAKLKDEFVDDMDLGSSGITVTFKTEKNRMAKPKKVKFEISFTKGMNPYSGLDNFCRPEYFEQIGVAQGKMVKFDKPKEVVDKKTGEVKIVNEEFVAGGNRWYARHIGQITKAELLTAKVFTPEVLEAMRPIIKDYFRYRSMEEIEEYNKQFELDNVAVEEDDDDDISDYSSSTSTGGSNAGDISEDELFG